MCNWTESLVVTLLYFYTIILPPVCSKKGKVHAFCLCGHCALSSRSVQVYLPFAQVIDVDEYKLPGLRDDSSWIGGLVSVWRKKGKQKRGQVKERMI